MQFSINKEYLSGSFKTHLIVNNVTDFVNFKGNFNKTIVSNNSFANC